MVFYDFNPGADFNGGKELKHVLRPHPDTTVAGRLSNLVLDWCPMNIDVPSVGMPVLGFQSFEPKDSANDRIAAGRIGSQDLAGRPAIFEHGSQRSTIADFLSDLQMAKRGCACPRIIAHTELRR